MLDLTLLGAAAKAASRSLALKTTADKNALLLALADAIDAQAETVLVANGEDIAEGKAKGLSDALLDRLSLSGGRLAAITACDLSRA